MHRTARVPIVLLFLTLTLSACSNPRPTDTPVRVDSLRAEPAPVATATGDPQALADHQARWQAQEPDSYRFTYTRGCYCPPQVRGPFEVTVREGKVAAATYKGEGEPMDRALSEYQTVGDLFALVAEAYERKAASVRVSYASETGQPTEIYIDYDEQVADEEVGFTVEPVRPLDG